jgi:hypothetical protein
MTNKIFERTNDCGEHEKMVEAEHFGYAFYVNDVLYFADCYEMMVDRLHDDHFEFLVEWRASRGE